MNNHMREVSNIHLVHVPSGRNRKRRQWVLRILIVTILVTCSLVFCSSELSVSYESVTSEKTAVRPRDKITYPTMEEPDILSYWGTDFNAESLKASIPAAAEDWELFAAPFGETTRLAPMCTVGANSSSSSGGPVLKPQCSDEELSFGSVANGGGATRARCVKRGYNTKCYAHNIILQKGNFFTYKSEKRELPPALILGGYPLHLLTRYHNYSGHPVREVADSSSQLGSSILEHCKYVITAPAVFLFRLNGHSPFHTWNDNVGPFFDTLHDDFGKADERGKGVFAGEPPVIIAVDNKPQHGPKAPRLLNELMHYFINVPILRASEFTEPTCFTRAVLGVDSRRFNQAALIHWLLPRVALRDRIFQLLSKRKAANSVMPPMHYAVPLRYLIPQYNKRLPFIFEKWLTWKLKEWPNLPKTPRVLYVSRNHPNVTRGRKVVNEAAVIPALEAAVLAQTGESLQRVFLEELRYIDQIMLMSKISILIAPHGGGIGNCIWMPPGSVVLEFVHPAGVTLPLMHKALCGKAAGRGMPPIKHISFIAEQDPAEREPGFEENNPVWRGNKRLLSNIWLPKERLIKYFLIALDAYRLARESAKPK